MATLKQVHGMIVKIMKGLERNVSDAGLRQRGLFVLEKRKLREILSLCLLKGVKKTMEPDSISSSHWYSVNRQETRIAE